MNLRFSWRYATRSLLRGGQYSIFALVCVTVGVLVIVALQLVSIMVNSALTGNIRAFNGGDLAVHTELANISDTQLTYFGGLQSRGVITAYSPVKDGDSTTTTGTGLQRVTFWSVDPAAFPLAGSVPVITPDGSTLAHLLQGNGAVITETLQQRLHMDVGDTLRLTTTSGSTGTVTITGEIATTPLISGRAELLMSEATSDSFINLTGAPSGYTWIFVNVPGHSDAAASTVSAEIRSQFPGLSATTAPQAGAQVQSEVDAIRTFLRIIGLLALLIGGVGIMNTMQVLLRRRQIEIAMLKTLGAKQRDLLRVFGIEAVLLGLVGGIIGAAAGIGLSFVVQTLVERAFYLALPTIIDPGTVLSGVAIGLATTLIFGLIPIVRASAARPLVVLREQAQGSGGSRAASLGLLVLLTALFGLLALSILGNLVVTVAVVLGSLIALGLLSAGFALLAWLVSRWPVPDPRRFGSLVALVPILIIALLLLRFSPAFGVLLLVLVAVAGVVAVLPTSARAETQLALRNIGRARLRSATTLVALFVGVFAVGMGLVLGQNIKDFFASRAGTVNQDNAYIIAGSDAAPQVAARISGLPDVANEVVSLAVPARVVSADGRTLPKASTELGNLAGVNGFNLAGGNLPPAVLTQGAQDAVSGRLLTSADAGTDNAVFPLSYSEPPENLKLNDVVMTTSQDGKVTKALRVVGFYTGLGTFGNLSTILADQSVAKGLGEGHQYTIFGLRLPEAQQNQDLESIQQAVPGTITLGDAATINQLNSILENILQVVELIASLAMFAGLVLIANTAALAMLERRRELGLLKAIGHTSRGVLAMVLVENGLLGVTGAYAALILVSLAATVLGRVVFQSRSQPGASVALTLALAGATAALCMLVAAAVAWKPTRVRPLDALRYE